MKLVVPIVRTFDVVVVGGGPSGLSASWSVASQGVEVVVLEEHEEIGRPRHCAGLVSGEGLRLIGMPCKSEYVENKIRKALVVADGFYVELKKLGEPVYVLDREAFDKAMANRATNHGAEISLKKRAKRVEKIQEGYVVKTSNGSYVCKVVIDGEGATSRLAKDMGLGGPKLKLPALQVDVKGSVNLDEVLVILGNEWAPGFFSWVIPLSDGELRVGLASITGYCDVLLTRLIKRHPIVSKLLRKAEARRRYGGMIVMGPSKKTRSENFMVVGDAAGQTKPLTGGGVVYGALCGYLAGVVASGVVSGEVDASLYERLWRRLLGLEERLGWLLKRVLLLDGIERLLNLASRGGLLSLIEKSVHYEYHVTSTLKRPYLPLVGSLLLALLTPAKAFKYILHPSLPAWRRSKLV
jgi:geranylgeranyl reductase family protein